MELFENSVFFGVAVSIAAYGLGAFLQSRFKLAVFNPLLISIAVTIIILAVSHIDYDTYYEGARYLSYLLTPATVCLAVPLYEKTDMLKHNWKAIIAGIMSGVLTTLLCIHQSLHIMHFEDSFTFERHFNVKCRNLIADITYIC